MISIESSEPSLSESFLSIDMLSAIPSCERFLCAYFPYPHNNNNNPQPDNPFVVSTAAIATNNDLQDGHHRTRILYGVWLR